MTDRYLDRDIELISAYIDSRLSPAETTKVKARLQSDAKFNQLLHDLTYTRRLLRALPQKRAPRNFTLSAEYTRTPRRVFWLQPAMSFISVAAAVTLVVLFASTYLLGGARNAVTEAPVPQSAEMRAMEDDASAPPIIINWNPVYGMGGGGADEPYAGGIGGGGAGGPGWDLTAPIDSSEPAPTDPPVEELPVEPIPMPESTTEMEEAPVTALAEPEGEDPAAKSAGGDDLSTMILGLPEAEVQGEVIGSTAVDSREIGNAFPVNLVMILSGAIAALAGAAAFLLRRH